MKLMQVRSEFAHVAAEVVIRSERATLCCLRRSAERHLRSFKLNSVVSLRY